MDGKKSADTDAKASAPAPNKSDLNLEIGRNIYEGNSKGAAVKKPEGTANGEATTNGVAGEDGTQTTITKVNCHQCGTDCTRVYYHSNQADASTKGRYEVCPTCLTEGRIPSNHTPDMYIKVENPTYTTAVDRDAPWTDAEILRLLEGLERFDEDWGEIADHVGTRTREECVLQFLQLDIEEKYLDSEGVSNAPAGLSYFHSGNGALPFSQTDNPVMSVVGFLASLADPASTAAAANKSADELKKNLRKQLTKTEDGATNGEKGKDGDNMDVDGAKDDSLAVKKPTTGADLASIPLASIGARASAFASHEEREMTRLVSAATNVMLQKLEMKLKYFNEMESILREERRELERGRQQLFLDRLAFRRRVRDVQDSLKSAAEAGGEQGARLASEAVRDADHLSFQPAGANANIQPPSAEGQVKSFEM